MQRAQGNWIISCLLVLAIGILAVVVLRYETAPADDNLPDARSETSDAYTESPTPPLIGDKTPSVDAKDESSELGAEPGHHQPRSLSDADRERYNRIRERYQKMAQNRQRLEDSREERKARRQKSLDDLYRIKFGFQPDNPIDALGKLNADSLERFSDDQAFRMGRGIAETVAPSEWMPWFESGDPLTGLSLDVSAIMLGAAVAAKRRDLSASPESSRRLLAIVDSYLEKWQGRTVKGRARTGLLDAFDKICPVDGGLELIRRWTVVNPHGDEVVEMRLTEALHFWPIVKSGSVAVESLETRRGGPIKGVCDSWLAAIRGAARVEWSPSDIRSRLALPLTECVMETSSRTGILYAENFVGGDLLESHCSQIGQALLDRRDSAAVSSYGFRFLRRADPDIAESKWTAWLFSGDAYQAHAACASATGMGAVARETAALDRMYRFALDDANTSSLRSVAMIALSVLDHTDRALAALEATLAEPDDRTRLLVAKGRVVIRSPRDKVVPVLASAIEDATTAPARRHEALFLLATIAPKTALTYCEEDLPFLTRFRAETILLTAATAEAIDGSDARLRARDIRRRLTEPEPEWIRAIRLRLSEQNPRPEHKVITYARVTTN